MSMSADHVGTHGNFLKNFWETLMRNPGLMIAILVVGAIVVYILIQQQNASSTTTAQDQGSLAAATTPGGYYYYQPPDVVTPIYISPPTIPATTTSGVAATQAPAPVSVSATSAATVPSSPVSTTPTGNATIPSTDPAHSSFFGSGFEVIQTSTKGGGNTWSVYNQSTKTSTPLANIFPKGTTFTGGGGGVAYYTLPGGTPQPLSAPGYYGHR